MYWVELSPPANVQNIRPVESLPSHDAIDVSDKGNTMNRKQHLTTPAMNGVCREALFLFFLIP